MIFNVPEELVVTEGGNLVLKIGREGFLNASASIEYNTYDTNSSKEGDDYKSDQDVLTFAVGQIEREIKIETYYNFTNNRERVFWVSFRPLEEDVNYSLGFKDGRDSTRIRIIPQRARIGGGGFVATGNVNPSSDIDNTVRSENRPDPEPNRNYRRDYTEDDFPDSNELPVSDPEGESGDILLLSTVDDEDKEELSSSSDNDNKKDSSDPDNFNSFENNKEESFPGDTEDDIEDDTSLRKTIEDTSDDILDRNRNKFYVSDPNDLNDLERYISINTDKTIYDSGEIIIYKITTKNIKFGEVYSYRLITSDSNIIDGSVNGSFVVESENNVVVVTLRDLDYNLVNTLDFVITDISLSHSVLVRNRLTRSSRVPTLNSQPRSIIIDSNKIVTDSNGGILDIPIDDSGDSRYREIPYVSISGGGYGARAIPILSNDGSIDEIRVIDPGLGYVVNQPNDLVGIIDDFTVIRPGFNYDPENPPDIIINGDSDVARVVVNEDGFVVGARLLKRDSVYDSIPEVRIIGDGYGAKLVPSLVFVPLDVYRDRLESGVRIRKGVYIDCP